MNSILRRPVIVGAVIGAAGLAAVIVALSLSGGSGSAASTTTASRTTTSPPATGAMSGRKGGGSRSTVNAAQAWHNLAQCIRSHGYAIADPTVNPDGTSSWSSIAGGGPPRDVREAEKAAGKQTCRAEWKALPPQAVDPPPTQAELHSLVLFAGCMRDHGLADWPDPNAQGAFPLNTRLLALGKRGTVNQLRACERHLPGGGIAVEHPGAGGSKNG